MDHLAIAAEHHIGAEEAANEAACYSAAQAAGKTQDEADNCDAGDCSCPACPWRDW